MLVVLAMGIFLIGAVGLAIDASQLYGQRQMAQAAADAGAQAGASSIFYGTNATAQNPFATGSPPSSYTCSTTDGTTPCVYARLNGFGGTAADVVSVSFPSSVPGVTLASVSVPVIAVTVRRTVNTTLIRFLGPSTTHVTAAGTAALVKLPLANCITTLEPTGTGLSIVGNANLSLTTCGIGIDSNSSSALSAVGNITVRADSIQVVGGASEIGNVSIQPTPTTHASAVSDPLASVPPPSYNPSHCDYTNLSYTGNQTYSLSPGTYCGGITATGNVTLNFSAGTYILLGGGLNATGTVSLSGSNLTFYNTFDASYPYAPISLTGNVTLNLSATTSGPLAGMLFFEDRNAPTGSTDSITGNANSNLTGALYFPRDQLSYIGNSSSTNENIAIVAQSVSFTGNASFKEDPTQAGAAQQIKVALVQ